VSIRIATYNIRRGGAPRLAALARVLRELDVDLAVLQEATDPAVVRELALATASRVVLQAPGRSVAVLGREEPLEARWRSLAPGRTASDVHLEGGIRILGVHLTAGLSQRGERRRVTEVGRLLSIAGEGAGIERTAIVGDLNAVAPGDVPMVAGMPRWIRLLLRVDGGITTSAVERILAAGFVDAFRRLHPTSAGATLPAAVPLVRLDYVLTGRDVTDAVGACDIGSARREDLVMASDHLPLVVELASA
jgi:endonuclease/exonuclease/phosphatase family metal-dependent hydrolase